MKYCKNNIHRARENEKTILIKKFICIKEVWSLNMDKLMHEINKGWIKIWEIPFWFIALSGYHRLFWWVLCCWRPFNLLSYCVEVMNFDCKQNFQAASIRLSHYTAWSYEITVPVSLTNIMQMAGSLVRRKFFNMGIYDNVCFVQMKMKKNLTIYGVQCISKYRPTWMHVLI